MQLDGTRILVTGGAGLIGSTTVDLLLREHAPAQVVVLDNLSRGNPDNLREASRDPRLKFVRGDVRDPASVRSAMRGIDAVLHLAALRITACAAEPREALQVMCHGSFNVVEAAHAAGVHKVVAASSASVYGQAEDFPTREDHHPWGNDTWYGTGKLMLEGLLRAYRAMHGLAGVSLRYFNVYGPRMDTEGAYTEVLIRWMERIAQGHPPLILGDGSQTMDFVHVRDVARANLAALRSDCETGSFNIASGTETSLLGLAGSLLQAMDSPLQPVFGPPRAVSPVTRRLADVSQARAVLGFEAEVPLADGLRDLVAWWRMQAAGARAQAEGDTARSRMPPAAAAAIGMEARLA
jgi:UDP-glucose 4-epimerase